MNNDLISRSELKKAIEPYRYAICGFEGVLALIDNAPTVEINTNDIEYKAYCKGLEDGKKIARPQGEWRPKTDFDGFTYCVCSSCNWLNYGDELNFCPNCGADMKGEQNG